MVGDGERFVLLRAAEALRDYDGSLALRPDNPPILVGRGQARMLLGDKAGAAADFDRALRLAAPGVAAPRGGGRNA